MNCRRCDHSRRAHAHYRAGRDCAIPRCDCERYGLPWGRLVLRYGGWLFVPLGAALIWYVARAWSLTAFVVWATGFAVLWSLAGWAGRFLGSEVAEQIAAGGRIRELPAFWWAVARHRIGDTEHDAMVLLDEHTRLDDNGSGS